MINSPQSSEPDKVFRTIFDTYQRGRQLGQGGTGFVFEVLDSGGNRWALKTLESEAARDVRRRKRFENEVRFGQKNTHRHVITIRDWGMNGDVPFYVFRAYDCSFKDVLKDKLTPENALKYLLDVMNGIEAAHLQQITHRDIKPENILFDRQADIAVVADFGIARFHDEELWTAAETRDGERLANYQYAAPEQLERGRNVDLRADIFALGKLAVRFFTGEVPLGTSYPKIRSVSPQHAYLDPIVERMMAHSPADRYQSIREIKDALEIAEGETVLQQKLSAASREVIPSTEVDDPLVLDPIRVIGHDYVHPNLIFELNQVPNPEWRKLFSQCNLRSSQSNITAKEFHFILHRAIVKVSEQYGVEVSDSFVRWVPLVNRDYANSVRSKLDTEALQHKAKIQLEADRERKRLALLKKLSEQRKPGK